ncbi:MAG: PRD domain-containing protein, partial [Longicatena sp.]
ADGKQVTSQSLARTCDKSVRTIQQSLKELKCILGTHGALLTTSQKVGYQLEVFDAIAFQTFYDECIYPTRGIVDTKDDRTIYILQRLLEHDDYIKSDDLSDELFSSKSTIHQNMKDMKSILKKYGLYLNHKPYYGMRIEGNEKAKRKCIMNEIMAVQNFVVKDYDKLFEKVNEVTANCFIKMQYKVDDVALMNLLMHIYINIKRMMKNNFIAFDTKDFHLSTFSHEIQMAKEIYVELASELNFSVTEDEIKNLAIYIKAKRNYESGDVITEEVNTLISEMLSYIKEKLNIDLSYDVELQIALALHFLPLNIRLANDIQLKNTFMDDIKQKFTFAYELATSSGAFLNEKFGYVLNETELSYL